MVHHVPEIKAARFLSKRRRDARAHTRIVRTFPKRKRSGPDLDFIGSSTFVLTVFPLWMTVILTGIPFIYSFISYPDWTWELAQTWWQTKVLILTGALMAIHEFILWRGPLGVVNRGAISSGSFSIVSILKVRNLTLRWSFALWQGLLLGFIDAIKGANGHPKFLSRKKN